MPCPQAPPRLSRPLRFPRPGRWWLLFSVVALLIAALPAAGEPARQRFDLPAGAAVMMLKRVAQQAGLEIAYSAAAVQGVQTQPVAGELTPREALERMVAATPLKIFSDPQTGALSVLRTSDSTPHPAPSEKTVPATMTPRPLLAALAGLFAASTTVDAQTTAPSPDLAPRESEIISLNAFTVSAKPADGYRTDRTVSGTLIATDVKRMPASIQVVTEALIADMDTRRVEDSIRFVSGVGLGARNEGSGGGSRSEQFVVRGFQTSQVLRNGIRLQGITNSANLERIEVLKGPSSIFFGASDPGGVINVITKKPLAERYGSVRLGFGDNNYKYAEFDFNQPIIEKTLLFRFMGSQLDTDGWRKFWHDEQTFLSAVAEWNPTATTRVTVDAQHRKQDGIQERLGDVFLTTDRPAPFTQQLLTGAALARSIELGALTPTDTYEDEANFYSITVTQKLGDRLLFSAVHGASDSNRLQRTTVTRNRIAVNDNFSYFDRPGIAAIGAINRTFNLNVLATFDVIGTKHKLVAGWDRSEIGNSELLFAWANNSPFTTKRFLFDAGSEAEIFGVRRYPTLADIGTPGGRGDQQSLEKARLGTGRLPHRSGHALQRSAHSPVRHPLERSSGSRPHRVDAAIRRDLRDNPRALGLRSALGIIPPQRAREHHRPQFTVLPTGKRGRRRSRPEIQPPAQYPHGHRRGVPRRQKECPPRQQRRRRARHQRGLPHRWRTLRRLRV